MFFNYAKDLYQVKKINDLIFNFDQKQNIF